MSKLRDVLAIIVIQPGIFRLLFLLNALFPAQTEAMMCRKD